MSSLSVGWIRNDLSLFPALPEAAPAPRTHGPTLKTRNMCRKTTSVGRSGCWRPPAQRPGGALAASAALKVSAGAAMLTVKPKPPEQHGFSAQSISIRTQHLLLAGRRDGGASRLTQLITRVFPIRREVG